MLRNDQQGPTLIYVHMYVLNGNFVTLSLACIRIYCMDENEHKINNTKALSR